MNQSGGYYARNMSTNTTILLDVDDSGNQPCCIAGNSCSPEGTQVTMDSSGNRIVFATDETLDGYDGTKGTQNFVHDIAAGTTRGVTINFQGHYIDNLQNGFIENYISGDGSTTAFGSRPCQVDETAGDCGFVANIAVRAMSTPIGPGVDNTAEVVYEAPVDVPSASSQHK